MAVIRSPLPHASFTMVRNCWLRDQRVSYKAKGLLGYLLSHSEGYKISQAQMVRESDDGREAVRSGLEELERAGYLTRTRSRSAGRYAEDDYALADPFDAAGKLLDPTVRDTALFSEEEVRETRQSGKPDAGNPTREIAPIEEQREETTPAPTEQAPGDDGRHLRAVDGPTVNQRANALTREHYDASNGMVPFAGVLQIVRRALDRGGYEDAAVRKALALLRESGRPVTLQTLHAALETPENVGGRRYGAPAGPSSYRDAPPDEHRGAF